MTNLEKQTLRWNIKNMINKEYSHALIISKMVLQGYKRDTIKKYIHALSS